MDIPTNYLGAVLFWLYIVAALGFTGIVINVLFSLSQTYISTGQQSSHARTYIALAAVSFVILSFNMLRVLIVSYMSWSYLRHSRISGNLVRDIWHWSSTSSLFHDFGLAIVANDLRYAWTVFALSVTFVICLFMAQEGAAKQIPRVWAFFCLAQILPISFAQNLFYIALELRPQATKRQMRISTIPFCIALVAYTGCLLIAPAFGAGSGEGLIRLILVIRALLCAPLALDGHQESGISMYWSRLLASSVLGIIVVRQLVVAWQISGSVRGLMSALLEHPAVSALGCDGVISIMSTAVKLFLARRTEKLGDAQRLRKAE